MLTDAGMASPFDKAACIFSEQHQYISMKGTHLQAGVGGDGWIAYICNGATPVFNQGGPASWAFQTEVSLRLFHTNPYAGAATGTNRDENECRKISRFLV